MKINDFGCGARLCQSALLCLRRHLMAFVVWLLAAARERRREILIFRSNSHFIRWQSGWSRCTEQKTSMFQQLFCKIRKSHLGGSTHRSAASTFPWKQTVHYKLFICMTNRTHFGRCYSPSLARFDNNRTSSRTDQIVEPNCIHSV